MSRKPSVRNRRIGAELRKLREELDLTLRAAGRRLERSPGSLSQIGNGSGIRARDLVYILDQYGVEDPSYREALLELARTARKSGWWPPRLPISTMVMLETLDRMSYVEDPAEVHRYGDIFDRLRAKAMTGSESRAFIERIRSEL